jgi:hypothetical protein
MIQDNVRLVERRSEPARAPQSAERWVAGTVPASVHWPAERSARSLER